MFSLYKCKLDFAKNIFFVKNNSSQPYFVPKKDCLVVSWIFVNLPIPPMYICQIHSRPSPLPYANKGIKRGMKRPQQSLEKGR